MRTAPWGQSPSVSSTPAVLRLAGKKRRKCVIHYRVHADAFPNLIEMIRPIDKDRRKKAGNPEREIRSNPNSLTIHEMFLIYRYARQLVYPPTLCYKQASHFPFPRGGRQPPRAVRIFENMGAKRVRRGQRSVGCMSSFLSARKTTGKLNIIADDYNYAVAA